MHGLIEYCIVGIHYNLLGASLIKLPCYTYSAACSLPNKASYITHYNTLIAVAVDDAAGCNLPICMVYI